MEKTFFIITHRTPEDVLAALHNEVDERIELERWRDDVSGFYLMTLPDGVDFYKTYELFHFLQFNVTYINVPVEFDVRTDTGFGKHKTELHREPLASWKTIDRRFVREPVPVDRMTGQIADRMGLSQIKKVEKQRTSVPLMGVDRDDTKTRSYIIELGSEAKDKEEVHEIEVIVYRDGVKRDWEEDLRQLINIKLYDLLKKRNRQWVFARKLGTTAIIQQLTAAELKKPVR